MEHLSEKRSPEDDDETTNTRKKKTVSTNRYLTYDVLRIIFKYLNGMELVKVAMVCRSWLEVANDEKRTRGGFNYLIYNLKEGVEHCRNQITKKLQIKPVLGLFFKAPCDPYSYQGCHCKALPTNCDVITLRAYGILIDNNEIENALENVVCAFLPDIPNVKIETVAIAYLNEYGYTPMITALPRLKGSNFKCLLLFCNQRGRQQASMMAQELKIRYKVVKLSVWGGVVNDLRICNSKNPGHGRCGEIAHCIAVALFGSVDTWSIVIDESYSTKELVEQRLISFKSHVSLKKHSIGFMFACCERGENMFDEYNVESFIFKKLFPEVPLVGCFGDGEFGETTIPSETSKKGKKLLYSQRSTVFLIITYG